MCPIRLVVLKLWPVPQLEWRPSWICPMWRPRREPSLAPAENQKHMTWATSGPNLVLVERFEQLYD